MGPGDRGIVIIECAHLRPDRIALKRSGRVVWVGPLSDPWEDVDCDTIILSSSDYAATKLRTLPDGRVIPSK